jgi:pyrimidine operon attenuation protein/uracil phosphoribosyltransferase
MHASYLRKIFNHKKQNKVVSDIKLLIKERELKFDGFVVTGVSGVAMGAILARSMRKELIIVRKDNDGTHSSYSVENYHHGKSYIFLDDLIASGRTYQNVKLSLDICRDKKYLYGDKNLTNKSKLIGAIFYDPTMGDNPEFWTLQRIGKKIKNH